VADEDWSPGWVVWRNSPQWIGWAPMPPEQDIQLISSPEFNNDKLWLFMEAQKFMKGGCGNAVQASKVFNLTQYVTLFDLPPGQFVDIVVVPKWKVKVITKFVTIFIDRICPPVRNPPTFNPPAFGPPANKPPNSPRRPVEFSPRQTETQPPFRIRSVSPTMPGPVIRVSSPPHVRTDPHRHPEGIGKRRRVQWIGSEPAPQRPNFNFGRATMDVPIMRTQVFAKVSPRGRSPIR
jgi:hypothetical protein